MARMTIGQAYGMAVRRCEEGQIAEAEALLRQILAVEPAHPDSLQMLGVVLHRLGRGDEGLGLIRRAIALRPDAHAYQGNLGAVLIRLGRYDQAVEALQAALALAPNSPTTLSNLGTALSRAGRIDEAIAALRRAIELKPDLAYAISNLAGMIWQSGEISEAIQWYDRALALRPDAKVASNRLFVLHFHPEMSPALLLEEHRRWDEQYARPLSRGAGPHANVADPQRRLRVGYVSPHLRAHAVGQWMLPLLAHHDRAAFEIFCYSDVADEDVLTRRLRGRADVWRATAALWDEALAAQVRHDRIDILVDLTMHMEGSRLLAFARKPAPVQVTYLAYPGTTGLGAMDYRLTDPHLDPAGMDKSCYSEKLVRLPRTWCCYQPSVDCPEPGPLPARSAGRITFGCLNNYGKLTRAALECWGRLLDLAPDSQLLVHAPDGGPRERVRRLLAGQEIDAARIRFVGPLPLEAYFAQYQQIDVALDPFPYTGGTTSCDALWMGVPVVTLAGATAASRGSLTLLMNLGLEELVAGTPEQYLRIVSALARDLDRLASLRATLRSRMLASPLMDGGRFAQDVESAYREMWRTWCRRRGAG